MPSVWPQEAEVHHPITADNGPSHVTARPIALWKELMPLIQALVPLKSGTFTACIQEYYEFQQRRVDAAEMRPGALRDSKAQLGVLLVWCGIQELNRVADVQPHSFNDFLPWQRDQSLAVTTGKAGVMRRSSLNKAVRELRQWWKWGRSQKYSEIERSVKELSTRKQEPRQRNVAFSDKDWDEIQSELKCSAFTEAKGPDWKVNRVRPVQWYGRRNFYYLMLTLMLSGMRPQEAELNITWNDLQFRNKRETTPVKQLDPVVVVRIQNDAGKGPRSVAIKAGALLKGFKKYANDWRKEHGYAQIKGSDLAFCYPPTGKAYSNSHCVKMFRDLLRDFGLSGNGCTIRSTRAAYIIDRQAEGKPPHIVARNCGHDLKVMMRDYEQLNEEQLIDELL